MVTQYYIAIFQRFFDNFEVTPRWPTGDRLSLGLALNAEPEIYVYSDVRVYFLRMGNE